VSSNEPSATSPVGLQAIGGVTLAPSIQRARDGSVLRWGEADTPPPPALIPLGTAATVAVAVSPARPGHSVVVEYRFNGGHIRQAIGLAEGRAPSSNERIFRAVLPGQPAGLVEFLPVLRFAGQRISCHLAESIEAPRYRVSHTIVPVVTAKLSAPPSSTLARRPRWAWDTKFLGSLTATVSKEVVGITPDGLRINWHVKEGSFIGPSLDAVVLPGATDWMRIRGDGVAIVNVQACFETRVGQRIYGSYGGIFDLGPEGYGRAVRGEFAPLPPVVVTPTYATADKQLQWLNRAQCIGVGRVDMKAQRVEFDVYIIQVGPRQHAE
jgi:Protein of unknown function (DUF3237)